jgi:hypothetical protein
MISKATVESKVSATLWSVIIIATVWANNAPGFHCCNNVFQQWRRFTRALEREEHAKQRCEWSQPPLCLSAAQTFKFWPTRRWQRLSVTIPCRHISNCALPIYLCYCLLRVPCHTIREQLTREDFCRTWNYAEGPTRNGIIICASYFKKPNYIYSLSAKCRVGDEAPNFVPRVWQCAAWSGLSHTSWGGDRWVRSSGGLMISRGKLKNLEEPRPPQWEVNV